MVEYTHAVCENYVRFSCFFTGIYFNERRRLLCCSIGFVKIFHRKMFLWCNGRVSKEGAAFRFQ